MTTRYADTPPLDATTIQLLAHLHRAGTYATFWVVPGRRTYWYEVGQFPTLPHDKHNIYFGVHPLLIVPPKNAQGEVQPPAQVRSQIEHIAAINCLFGEFDAKDFDDTKAKALAHIKDLAPAPSIIIDSGGGYHCYWLLAKPFVLQNEDDRQRAMDGGFCKTPRKGIFQSLYL